MSLYAKNVAETFAKLLSDSYQLENRVIINLKKLLIDCIQSSDNISRTNCKIRKITGWNIFIKLINKTIYSLTTTTP